jgi:hypothetical protein
MAWIESHQSLLTHRKTIKLARLLDCSKFTVIGHLHALWWWALDNAPSGDLSSIDAADIAECAGWTGDALAFVDALADSGFLDRDGEELYVHDWDDYAGKLIEQRRASADRVREWRDAQKSETRTQRVRNDVTVPNSTGPDSSPPSSSPRASSKPKPRRVVDVAAPPPHDWQLFGSLLDGLPGWLPSADFWTALDETYRHVLPVQRVEAMKIRSYVEEHRSRKCSVGFVLNWLSRVPVPKAAAPVASTTATRVLNDADVRARQRMEAMMLGVHDKPRGKPDA